MLARFVGYSGDCTIVGEIDASTDVRLADLLNEKDSLQAHSVQLFALEDGRNVDVGDLEIPLSDLHVVTTQSSLGSPERRIKTRTERIQLRVGPYEVLGNIHSPSAGDPMYVFAKRRPMIPLTDVLIVFDYAGTRVTHQEAFVVINRRLVSEVNGVAYVPVRPDEIDED